MSSFSLTANGKSICEERATLWGISKENRFKQNAFSDYQITKKSNMKSKLRLNAPGFSIRDSTPPFANTMLCAVFYSQFLSDNKRYFPRVSESASNNLICFSVISL